MKWRRFQRPGHRRVSCVTRPQRGRLSITVGTSKASTLGKKMQENIDPKGAPSKSQRKFSNREYELPSIAFMYVEHSSVGSGA